MCPSVWFPSERDAPHQPVIIVDRTSGDIRGGECLHMWMCLIKGLCESSDVHMCLLTIRLDQNC